MKKRSGGSIKLNFIMNAILTLSSILFPLLTFRYVSRILLPVGTGKVSFATSFISYFSMFAQLGIPTYGIRLCAKVRDDREKLTKTVQELFIINIVMTVIAYAAFFVSLAFLTRFRDERPLYLVVSLTILFNAIGMEWLYKGLEEYTYITVRSLIFKIIALISLFFLVKTQDDYILYGGISIFAASASNIMNFIHSRKYIDSKIAGSYNFHQHFKPIAVFFAMTCATMIYLHIDAVMLGFMKGDEAVGYYDAAVKIRSVLVSLVTSLGAVLLPRASYYVQNGNMDEFYRVTKKAMHFVILVACPLMVYFTLFARQGILFLSGTAYESAVIPMQIIMPTLLLVGITNVSGIQMLVPLGKEKTVLYSEIAGALVNLVINAALIPKYGPAGAAVGTLAAEFAVLTVQVSSLRNRIADFFGNFNFLRLIIALAASSVASLWTSSLALSSFMTLAISSILFFGTYGIIMFLSKEPLVTEIWKQMIGFMKKAHGKMKLQ